MDAAFSQLESMWEDLSLRALLPNLPTIRPDENTARESSRLLRVRSSDGLSPISRHVPCVEGPSSSLPQDNKLGGSFIIADPE